MRKLPEIKIIPAGDSYPVKLYLCDRKQCVSCNPECKHTTNIEHAVNFIKFGDRYIENEISSEMNNKIDKILELLQEGVNND